MTAVLPDSPQEPKPKSEEPAGKTGSDPLELIEQCLALFPETDPRQKLLYKLRHACAVASRHSTAGSRIKKVSEVVSKLTAPANRIGTLLDTPGRWPCPHIVVGGAEYYTNVDPRVAVLDSKIGTQMLVNEAYAVIKTLGYDANGPVLKMTEATPRWSVAVRAGDRGDRRLILQRSSDLVGIELKAGDEVRIDPTHRIAIERLDSSQSRQPSAR